ncbi:MAG TPA: methyltransferase domain-containing protein, partial [Pyrinomonadaceae bacterium]|nr:methyltransferase domain-containing protein [Pyrinomonadaceae bacterium]
MSSECPLFTVLPFHFSLSQKGDVVLNFVTNVLSAGAGAALSSQVTLRVLCQRTPHPMPHQLSATLDHSLRLRYRDPSETLGLLGFTAGMTVMDLGCGTGLFTVDMARMVGANGVVHAVDIQAPLVEQTRQRILGAGLAERVRFHHSSAYDLPVADESIDLAVMIATIGEIPERLRALVELRRVLKPDGRLAISEELPDPAYMTAGAVRQWAEDAGFRMLGKTGSFFCYT